MEISNIENVDEFILNSSDEKAKFNLAMYLEKLKIIPFDVINSISTSIVYFGYIGNGSNIGKYVKIKNAVIVKTETGDIDMNNKIGKIVADFHERIVVSTDDGYFGWIIKENYDFINYIEKESIFIN